MKGVMWKKKKLVTVAMRHAAETHPCWDHRTTEEVLPMSEELEPELLPGEVINLRLARSAWASSTGRHHDHDADSESSRRAGTARSLSPTTR